MKLNKYKSTYKKMVEGYTREDISAAPDGAFGDYPADTGAPASDVAEQPGYGGGPNDDARMPTGLYAVGLDGKKKKFATRNLLDEFLKKNKDWKKA